MYWEKRYLWKALNARYNESTVVPVKKNLRITDHVCISDGWISHLREITATDKSRMCGCMWYLWQSLFYKWHILNYSTQNCIINNVAGISPDIIFFLQTDV